jgi:predicted DNA binding CopG/RHH family protein
MGATRELPASLSAESLQGAVAENPRAIRERRAVRRASLSKTKKKLPEFKTEDRERNFWATADSTEYLDWPSAKRTKLVRLKPTLKTISLRLPLSMIEDLKVLANRRDVPYQSLLKVFLGERLARERQPRSE